MLAAAPLLSGGFSSKETNWGDTLVSFVTRSLFFTLNNRYMLYRPMGTRHAI